MRRFFSNDVTKLFIFLALTFILAAAVVPFVYNFGQFLADITANKSVNPLVDYLGKHARKADYARYFNRSLYLAALVLLPAFIMSTGRRPAPRLQATPWSFALPRRSIASERGQPLRGSSLYMRQLAGGFVLSTTILALTGLLALSLKFFLWKKGASLPLEVPGAFTAAVVVALIEEIVFRGIILGLFLRTFRPTVAIFLVALLFAGLHFLRPPAGSTVPDPESMTAGFAFLKIIFLRLTDAELMVQQFATLLVAGLILGSTRYLTSSLWLPIGLHAGWVFTLRVFDKVAIAAEDLPDWMGFLIGKSITEGFLPMGALGLTALLLWVIYREPDEPRASREAHPPPPGHAVP